MVTEPALNGGCGQQRSITLTVHLTMDERYEDGCVAWEVMHRLATMDCPPSWTEGVLVDAVTSDDGVEWGRHLTELAACPHCTTTIEHPLADGWGCTNEWHHLGNRARRAERRDAIRTADSGRTGVVS